MLHKRPKVKPTHIVCGIELEAIAYIFVTVNFGDCNVELLPPSVGATAAGSSTIRTCINVT